MGKNIIFTVCISISRTSGLTDVFIIHAFFRRFLFSVFFLRLTRAAASAYIDFYHVAFRTYFYKI